MGSQAEYKMVCKSSEIQKAALTSNYSKMSIRDESTRFSYCPYGFLFFELLNPHPHVNPLTPNDL
jgi:hypothetical protein